MLYSFVGVGHFHVDLFLLPHPMVLKTKGQMSKIVGIASDSKYNRVNPRELY